MSLWQKLRGTMETIFQIGKGGPNLRGNGGVVETRNAANSAFAIHRAADPVGNDDLLTLRYFNLNNAAAINVAVVTMPLATSTKVSTSSIPNNAIIVDARIVVTTPYDGTNPAFSITRTGDGTRNPLGTADSDLTIAGDYSAPQDLSWGSTGAGTVTATISGTGITTGVSILYLFYATPTDIS